MSAVHRRNINPVQFVFFWAEVSEGSTGVCFICGPCRGVWGRSAGAVGMLCSASLQSVRTLWSALERSEMKRNMFSHLLSVVWTWWVKGSRDCWLTLSFLCRTTEADGLTDAVAAGRAAGCQPAPRGLCCLPAALPGFISPLADDRSGKSDQRPMETLQDRTVLNLDRLSWDDWTAVTSDTSWRDSRSSVGTQKNPY